MEDVSNRGKPRIYADGDGVTFDVSVTASGEDNHRYEPVTLDGMRGVLVAADNGSQALVSFKGECVPTGYESPAGWLWVVATMLARIRTAYVKEDHSEPTDKEVVALLQQAIEENSKHYTTRHKKRPMEETKERQFLIELPGSNVKEIHGSRLIAVTDSEVAFAFHTDPIDIIDDVDNVLRVVCGEYVNRSNGEVPATAYLATCLTLLGMAVDEIAESGDLGTIERASEIINGFLSESRLKDMI